MRSTTRTASFLLATAAGVSACTSIFGDIDFKGAETSSTGTGGGKTTSSTAGSGGKTTSSTAGSGGKTTSSTAGTGGKTSGTGGTGGANGQVEWAKAFGDPMYQAATSVTVDSGSNVLFAGTMDGAVSFGGPVLTGLGAGDAFLAKLDKSGNHLWSRRYGDSGRQKGEAVAVDSSGNVFVGGYFEGTLDFGSGPLPGPGLFVAKLDPTGGLIWAKSFVCQLDGNADPQVRGMAVDPLGNPVFVGIVSGNGTFGANKVSGSPAGYAAALAGASGNLLWSTGFTGVSVAASSVAVDKSANPIVVGGTDSDLHIGTTVVTPAGGNGDAFVAKLDPTGAVVWAKAFGDALGQQATGVTVDASDHITLVGGFVGSIDWGGGGHLSNMNGASYDVFVAKLDPGGAHVWSHGFGSAGNDLALSVCTEPDGSLAFAGVYEQPFNFGGFSLPATTGMSTNMFLAKLDTAGGIVWARGIAGAASDTPAGLAADPKVGELVLVGALAEPLDFGSGAVTYHGGADAFVAKFAP